MLRNESVRFKESKMLEKLYSLRNTYREEGINGAFIAALRFFYRRQCVNILARPIDPRFFPEVGSDCPPDVRCIVLETPESLDPFCDKIPPSFRDSPQKLKARLAEGCVLFLAQCGGKADVDDKIIGYSLVQRGVFSALGRILRISSDVLFIHYIEVLPAYRRTGVAKVIVKCRYEYCKANAIRHTVTVGSEGNRLSQRAFRKQLKPRRLGVMRKISLLGRIWVWETPRQDIQKALDRLTSEAELISPQKVHTRYWKARVAEVSRDTLRAPREPDNRPPL